ncbi:MAG: IS66 family transposase, partial [Desulfovibrio sp.]|nr:IS66 family transposase [Desulfovibrio sp.]
LMGVQLSTGTLVSMVKRCASKIGSVLKDIKNLLIQNDVNHYDETGIRINGHLYWVHNSSSANLTYQTVHQKRGQEGINDNGVLGNSSGVAVHDCWAPYWKADNVTHAVCGAHLLRELEGVLENAPDHTWAQEFLALLLRMKAQKERDMAYGKENAGTYHQHKFFKEYDLIIQKANSQCPSPSASTETQKGRPKMGKECALICRLAKLKDAVCRFFMNYLVPFDNNLAERDLRNCKTKCKVSGCFRSKEGAQDYLSISSYISTGWKQGISAFEALTAAINGMANIVIEKFIPTETKAE